MRRLWLLIPALALPVWSAEPGSFGLPPLAGPLAPLIAEAHWIRAELALGDRRLDRALSFAERSVRTHRAQTENWRRLVALYLLQPSAAAAERRLAALDHGLELARAGLESCREPDDLARFVDTVLRGRAEAEADRGFAAELIERAEGFARDYAVAR